MIHVKNMLSAPAVPCMKAKCSGRAEVSPVTLLRRFLGSRERWPMRINGLQPNVIKSSNKKLLGAPGIATRSKDATRGSWPYY